MFSDMLESLSFASLLKFLPTKMFFGWLKKIANKVLDLLGYEPKGNAAANLNGNVIFVQNDNIVNYINEEKVLKEGEGISVYSFGQIEKCQSKIFNDGFVNSKESMLGRTYIYNDKVDKYILNDDNVEINFYKAQAECFIDFVHALGAVECDYGITLNGGIVCGLSEKWEKLAASEEKDSWFANIKRRVAQLWKNKMPKSKNADYIISRMNLNCEMRGELSTDGIKEAENLYNSKPMLKCRDCKILLKERNWGNHPISFNLSGQLQSFIDLATRIPKLQSVKRTDDYCKEKKVNKSVEIKFYVKF